MSVYLDGSTLSALIFSHLNAKGSQYGFLIGEKIEHIEDKISDSQIHAYDVNSYIYVSSFIPWPHEEYIHSRTGHINAECFSQLFPGKKQNIVGWYSFRHNTTSRQSLRETNLHNNLTAMEMFSGHPQDFIFFLCTSLSSDNMSIHTCNYNFMHQKDGHFYNLPITTMNLGDTTRKEYQKKSNTSLQHSTTIQKSLKGLHKQYLMSSGEMKDVVKIKSLASSLNDSMLFVHREMVDSETTLGLLNAEVSNLRHNIDLLERQEAEMIFRIEAENKRKLIEEEKRKCDVENIKEQEQLQSLLIDDFGILNDKHKEAAVASNLKPEASLSDNCANDQQFINLHGHIPASSYFSKAPPEQTLTKNNSSNVHRIDSNNSNKTLTIEHTNVFNVTEEIDNKCTLLQTKENAKSDSFKFIDEEITINLQAPKVNQICSNRNTSNVSTLIQNQAGSRKSALDIHELSYHKSGLIAEDVYKDNSQLNDTQDYINKYSLDVEMKPTEDLETSQSDHDDKCEDQYIASSSPVF